MNPDKTVFIANWRGGVEDVRRLVETIISRTKLGLELFCCDGRLHWLAERKLTPVSTHLLSDLLARHFTQIRLAVSADGYAIEYVPLNLDRQALIDTLHELELRCAPGPSKPRTLSERERQWIKERVRQGEPQAAVAQAYGVDVVAVRAVMVAA
jgi:hypothetical protein